MIQYLLGVTFEPAFTHHLRRIRWVGSEAGFYRLTRRVFFGLVVAAVVLFIGVGWALWDEYDSFSLEWFPYVPMFITAGLLFAVGGYVSWLGDLTTLFFCIGVVREDINLACIDMMRLGLGEERFINAKYSLGIARAWRVVSFIASIRLLAVAIFLLAGVVFAVTSNFWSDIPAELRWDTPIFISIYLPLTVVLAAFVGVQPLLQMRLLGMLAVYISARVEGRTAAILSGLVGWFVLGSLVGVFFFIGYVGFFVVGFGGTIIFDSSPQSEEVFLRIFLYVIVPVILLGLSAALFWFYRYMSYVLVQNTVKHLKQSL